MASSYKAECHKEILAIKRRCQVLGIALTPKREVVALFMIMGGRL